MSSDYNSVLPLNFKFSESDTFLKQVFAGYNGKLFVPKDYIVDVEGGGFKSIDVSDYNFERICNYIPNLSNVFLNINGPLTISIWRDGSCTNGPDLNVYFPTYLIFSGRDDELEVLKENYSELIDFSIALMRANKSPHLLLGRIAEGPEPEKNLPSLILCEGDSYPEILQKSIKCQLGLELSADKIKTAVGKFALSHEVRNSFTAILLGETFYAQLTQWARKGGDE